MSRNLRWMTALILVISISGCGGEDNAAPPVKTTSKPKLVPVEKWADQVCTAMAVYTKNAPNPDDLGPSVASASRLSQARFNVESFFRDYSLRAEQLVFDLEASDIPNVEGGAAARLVFNSYFERAATALGSVQARVNEIGVHDPTTFRDRVQAIIGESQTAFVTNDLEQFATVNAPMHAAFSAHPVCAGLPYGILP